MIRDVILELLLRDEEKMKLKNLSADDKEEILHEEQFREFEQWYLVAKSASFRLNSVYHSDLSSTEKTLRAMIRNLALKHQYKYVYTNQNKDNKLPYRPTIENIIPDEIKGKIEKEEVEIQELCSFKTQSFISYPWAPDRYSIMSSRKLQEKWEKNSNHRIEFYHPIEVGFFFNGMHSGFSGIMLEKEDLFNPYENGLRYNVNTLIKFGDITEDLHFIYKDENYNISEKINPFLWELALIFKIEKVIHNGCEWK